MLLNKTTMLLPSREHQAIILFLVMLHPPLHLPGVVVGVAQTEAAPAQMVLVGVLEEEVEPAVRGRSALAELEILQTQALLKEITGATV